MPLYAWPEGQQNKTDLSKRIRSDEHPTERGECCLCGGAVRAVKNHNGIFEWMHFVRCGAKRSQQCKPQGK